MLTSRKYRSLAVLGLLLLAGCSSSVRFSKDHSTKEHTSRPVREDNSRYSYNPVVLEAQKWLGTPYCYGGNTSECTDCSGFVCQVFSARGITLPRTSSEQYEYVRKIPRDELQPGDIVFFGNGKGVSHVGIYVGGNEIIHASTSSGVIRQSLDDPYLKKTWFGAGRVI